MIIIWEMVRLWFGWGSFFMFVFNGLYNFFFCRGKFYILVSWDMLVFWCSYFIIDNIWFIILIDWDYKFVI